ncbi:mitoribosomal protein mS48 [Leishmania donovani]|uniref:Hypothetical_protein_conserved n=1 Tax=Leishmania donovani TaxID=5661 RepID=A0A6J8F8E1_LEIDO|nr:mitoribosomal protein mS48 [Leishmania donovani]VDZ43604.1 hypothetical_protein_conserved [Leishmania donovani]
MLRARARSAYTVARSPAARCSAAAAIGAGSVVLNGSSGLGSGVGAAAASAPLHEPRRYSFKYATKRQHNEARQPSYVHDKRYGLFSNERNIGKSRRGLPHITPIYTKHMSLWETDTDASTNRFFRHYVFGQREEHLLLGRPHGFEADQAGGRQGDSAYELNTDQRYKGVPRPAITNLHYEPVWNQTLYRNTAHGNQLTNPSSKLTAAVLGPELMEVRDVKSVEHCKAWFDRLSFLIQQHYDAVGDIGAFRSRHAQHVHEFFVAFHDALSSFDFQDHYLYDQFAKARPKHLEDLFAIFLEMEANYVNEDYCPRCSLPYATTRYCGEGDPNTPFRKHRGRWAPHQYWGKEWYDVVMRRAEALWYRATEDPFFGTTAHTQRQVEALLSVYIKTKHRAKMVDFLHALRGSKEFLLGQVQITPTMQKAADDLLDSTPHEHLLTNAFKLESRAAKYTGDAQSVPHSPLQMRLDMEMSKYRRQQREEGVVRVPPASWKLDTSAIVPYKVDPQTKHVANWRAVKEGIEQSFLATGLPKEAYTSEEWREMLYLKERIASRGARRAQLEAERQAEEAAMAKKYGQHSPAATSSSSWCVFPDTAWYRVFETAAEVLKPYGVTHAGQRVLVRSRAYANPAAVPYTDPVRNASVLLDTTPEACGVFGGFESGEVLRLTPKEPEGAAAFDVVVVGVDKSGAEAEWSLYAMHRDAASQTSKGLLNLGADCLQLLSSYAKVETTRRRAVVTVLDAERTLPEEHLGQVVGVRGGELYVQWHLQRGGSSDLDRSVAVPLGDPETVKQMYKLQTLTDADGAPALLQEPPSWRTPFRNDFVDERLKELEQAPFKREQWASLIQGKYTPKVKKYGYAQHTTQDDFQTKEYKDRLLARQYFHNPQAFSVIPERHERSVKFMGKWEHQRVCGLPTVDRDELEKGWGEAEEITDAAVGAIEQALRDISGRRPGNFVKSPTETQSLRLNESWWTPLEFGWEEHNREQMAFLDSSERRIVEGAQLPFGGKRPPFGTTYGMGERISEIAADYAKGFGLGPNGHSPQHDTAHFNTLEAEQQRVKVLGLGNALVRLFHEKLGSQDIQAWALQQCGESDANVRQLLLSVEEWRTKGRAPSLLLRKVLQRYLKEELDDFNSGLPAHVPRLAVPCADASAADSIGSSSAGCIWVDVDRNAFALEHASQFRRGDSDESYIVGLVQRAGMSSGGGGALAASPAGSGANNTYAEYIQQDVLQRFQIGLARIVGRGIPSSIIMERTVKSSRGLERESAKMLTLVLVGELAKLLSKMRVTPDNISMVVRGLAQCPEKELLGGGDFAVPVSLIFSWNGPQSNVSTATSNSSSSNANAGASRGAGISAVQQMLERTRHGSSPGSSGSGDGDKMVGKVLEELAWSQDGVAADVLYALQQNKANPTLRQEFLNAFLPVCSNDHQKAQHMYAEYMLGKFVPNITVAIEAFVKFLGNISTQPEQLTSDVEYFEVDNARRADGTEGTGQYTQVRLLPPEIGPFQYENTLIESIETAERFRRYGILAGPARVPASGFIAANCKSLTYMTHRDKEVVYVTTENDQGLANALRSSALFKSIASNPKLSYLLKGITGGAPSHPLLVDSFNRFFYRVAPMLSFYQRLLKEYSATMPSAQAEAQIANFGLARALENEASTAIEQDFRRNAERYWRNVLEGRSTEEAALSSGGRESASAQGRRPSQQGSGRAGQSGSGSRRGSGEFNLASVVGHRAAAGARSEKSRAPASSSSSSSSNSTVATAASASTRVKGLLGSLKGGGSGAGRGKGSRPASPSGVARGSRGARSSSSNNNSGDNRGASGKK